MKKVAFIVIAAILFAIPSLCGAMDFYPLPPDKEAKIQALKEKVKARGGTYEIEYSAATDRDLSKLAGLRCRRGGTKAMLHRSRCLARAFRPFRPLLAG